MRQGEAEKYLRGIVRWQIAAFLLWSILLGGYFVTYYELWHAHDEMARSTGDANMQVLERETLCLAKQRQLTDFSYAHPFGTRTAEQDKQLEAMETDLKALLDQNTTEAEEGVRHGEQRLAAGQRLTRFSRFNLPAVALGIAGAVMLVIRQMKIYRCGRRIFHGLCVHCGYDLRGSTDHCPECGAAFERLPHN